VLVTDGQVGNEDQILRALKRTGRGVRTFALGIDRAVNEAFLRRLADLGGQGACDVVESEERLDEVMDAVHRRIGTPVLTELRLDGDDLRLDSDSLVPARIPDLFATAPVLVLGRYTGVFPDRITLAGTTASGEAWSQTVGAARRDNPAIRLAWARGQLRKLEDRYVGGDGDLHALEKSIVATSLRYGVLCRFTAYVAVDRSEVVNEGGRVQAITQPVELPEGWELPGALVASSPMAARHVPKMRGFRPPPCAAPSEPCFAPLPFMEGGDELMDWPSSPPPEMPRLAPAQPLELSPSLLRRARLLLARLRKALAAGDTALAGALRTLLPALEAWLDDLPAPAGRYAGLADLVARINILTALLSQPDPAAAALAEAAVEVETALAALTTDAGPGSGSGSGGSRRRPFWK
jgi:Ca-activated chloride channel family protein